MASTHVITKRLKFFSGPYLKSRKMKSPEPKKFLTKVVGNDHVIVHLFFHFAEISKMSELGPNKRIFRAFPEIPEKSIFFGPSSFIFEISAK